MIFGEEVLAGLRRYYELLEYADMPQLYDEMEMIDSVIENWYELPASDVEMYAQVLEEIFG